eukprot:TRINITY_DN4271_c0_g1_i4.p1 TRINITY_DN4271_c0_g1~~TRINITY_DN4271_c0_g1_i4.p1  ORF type:complete len:873 (+),score=336.63 TRINITY_DN4271_c0_g1_i4:2551-5169(+)
MAIAREQADGGADILDFNVDDGLVDGVTAMTKLLNLCATDPDICKLPFMVDSSKFHIVEAGLKTIQGKPIVNSISLKNGEEGFIKEARIIKKYGAAVVVMAFDEQGQAATEADKIRICKRAYDILVGPKVEFLPEDIIFDPNILTIGTGLEEHDNYGIDFMNATKWIKNNLPRARVSGGLSNLSFSYRGQEKIRQTMHSTFLYHACVDCGFDMAIVNAQHLPSYDALDPKLRELCTDLIFNRKDKLRAGKPPAEAMTDYAEKVKQAREQAKKGGGAVVAAKNETGWRGLPVEERVSHALVKGIDAHIVDDVELCRQNSEKYPACLNIIEGPLMAGMSIVGQLFGAGKMFLPQVIKSARVMKKAVAHLMPYMEREKIEKGLVDAPTAGCVVMATVKGDVHDIGKNIVGVVLGCNNYKVIDLGVMVPFAKILETAKAEKADIIGLSGLITPSLDEMVTVAKEMKKNGFSVPLLIGGATTSRTHTAVKVQPHYPDCIHVLDASKAVVVAGSLLGDTKSEYIEDVHDEYADLRDEYYDGMRDKKFLTLRDARSRAMRINWDATPPAPMPKFGLGTQVIENYPLEEVLKCVDWSPFFAVWQLRGKYPNRGYPKIFNDPDVGPQAKQTFEDGQNMLKDVLKHKKMWLKGCVTYFPVNQDGDDIIVWEDDSRQKEKARFLGLRQQQEKDQGEYMCLSDFVAPVGKKDYLAQFAVACFGVEEMIVKMKQEHDDYGIIMAEAIADRLAEAFAEKLHEDIRRIHWGYEHTEKMSAEDLIKQSYEGIRPAPGYPSQPDHTEKATMWELGDIAAKTGITLSEGSLAMLPAAAVSALVFPHPQCQYFSVGKIAKDQVEDYARRRGAEFEVVETALGSILGYDPQS